MFDGRWRHAVDRGTQPVGRILVRAHITADVITVFGLAMSVVTAFVVGTGHLLIGVGLLFPTGLPDLFDGPVAKASGTVVCPRRIPRLGRRPGVRRFLARRRRLVPGSHHHGRGGAAAVRDPGGHVAHLVPEGQGRAPRRRRQGRLMERAERFILLGLCFIAGSVSAGAFVPSLWVFLGLVLATALGRFVKGRRRSPKDPVPALKTRPPRSRISQEGVTATNGSEELDDPESAHSGTSPRCHGGRSLAGVKDERSRWRAWREARAQRESAVPRTSWTRKSGDPSVKRRPKRQGSSAGESPSQWPHTGRRDRTRPDGRARPER